MKYQTRKQLKAEIARLKSELSRKDERAVIINKADLPPCKSQACINCEHIAFHRTASGYSYLLGCGKDNECPDFKQKAYNLTEADKEALKSDLWLQTGEY